MSTSPVREVLSYEMFGTAVRKLAATIADDGFRPDVVIAVARGGLIPAGALSYALGTKAAGTLNVEFYTDIETTLPDPVVLEPLLDTAALEGKNLLVVDDVADSGRTLALVMDLMRQHGADARSAVLYTKPRTIVVPDYSWRDTDLWITFPWSAQPPVTVRES
ncbi:phosphoribosyltransferase [Nakamurella sp. YIM 132087]|uniref:Phosphoribosyltransferase n=1 Tax=Nakamurella alba TaxID=2665158 RepID=A0A7K1FN51_9ACTN|nr:phosphoribosyltransferase [Nakamurella alba]MTD15597.1 phosphoribosyltransferase [Nakamurella alba]